jgi:hypothetical protein
MHRHIVFFNHFHNGDIHASRGLIRQIMNKVHQQDPGVSFYCTHKNSPNLLADIPSLTFDANLLVNLKTAHENLTVSGSAIYINTWYAQQNYKYMNRYGISMDTLYAALNDSCQAIWGFSLSDISQDPTVFFPTIDYSKFHISEAQSWLYSHPTTKIFVENGNALSGQATNFSMTSVIIKLAQKYQDKIFILSNPEGSINLPPNIVYSSNIIRKPGGSDLNENSFLSSHCDMIIGRASGPFAFTLTQDNLFKRNTKFVCFSNIVPVAPNKFWTSELLRDKINYSADIVAVDEANTDMVFSIIDANMR